jgi:nucleotide-binding universal stress UspA family protein
MTGIVVEIDGSLPADAALAFACEEARLRKLPLRIACAWDIPAIEYAGAAFAPTSEHSAEAEHHAEEVLTRAVETIGHESDIEFETVAALGHPPAVLVEQSEGATLLVVGTRGRGGLASLGLGSVSQGSHITAAVRWRSCLTPATTPSRPRANSGRR